MAVLYSNNASSTLSASITSTATSLSVASGNGALFPAPTGGDYFYVTLVNTAGAIEIMKVTARSTDTFTVVRGQDGTSAAAWAAGDRVELRFNKALLDDVKNERMPAAGPSTGSNGRILINASGNPVWSDTTFTYDAVLGSFRAANLRAAIGDSAPTWNFNNILHAGNYSSYALPLSGGTMTGQLNIGTGTNISFGNQTRQMINLWGTQYGIGVQASTTYFRSDGRFSWHRGGSHSDSENNAGSGAVAMTLDGSSNLSVAGNVFNAGNQVLHAGNYTTYSPSLTGTGASGTWGISVTGSATSVGGYSSDGWLRKVGDASQFQIYGNTRSVIFRTDGTTNAHGGGAYPYIWFYGGSADADRRMILNTDGTIWSSNYGWLHTAFASASHTHNYMSADYSRPGGDLNSKLIPGNYGISNSETNRPADWGALIVGRSADVVAQWYLDHNNAFWIRGGNPPAAGGGGVWNSWREVLHSGNYSSYAAPASHTHTLLTNAGQYIWSASTTPTQYSLGLQTSFVSANEGFQSYGSVMTMNTYSGGGGALQIYVPYSPTYGGTGLQIRHGNYDVNNGNAWTSWKTLLDSSNYTSYGDGRYVQKTGDTMTGALRTTTNTGIFIGSGVTTSDALRINWHTDSDLNYYIGKRAGAWTQPMDIAFYTGLRYHTHYSYGGHRFYTTGVDGTQAFSIGDGDTDIRMYSNVRLITSTSPYTNYFLWGDNSGWIFRFMTNVSGTATERFRFSDTGQFNATGAITQGGNQVLHAGNYSSYALPLSGGTVTGTTTFSGTTYFNGVTYHTTTLDASGDLNLQGGSTGIGRFHIAATTGTTIVGGVSQSGTQTFGQSTVSHIVNIASGATSSANTKTVNIGTGGLSGAFTYLYLGSNSGTSYVNTYGTLTSYGTARVSASNAHSYLQLNRTSTSYEAGLNFQTGGTTYWWNYTPTGGTGTLSWFANGATRMALTNLGVLSVNGSTVVTASNISSYGLTTTGGTLSGNLVPSGNDLYNLGSSSARWSVIFGVAVNAQYFSNPTTLNNSFYLAANSNYMIIGPYTISTGYFIDVPTGSTLVII